MLFVSSSGNTLAIHLLVPSVVFNDTTYPVADFTSSDESRGKFTFDEYIVKYSDNKLNLYRRSDRQIIETFFKNHDPKAVAEVQTERTFYVSASKTVSLNVPLQIISTEDGPLDIIDTKYIGIHTVYSTLDGELRVSHHSNFPSLWRGASLVEYSI